mgnify:CR=1 FL=1
MLIPKEEIPFMISEDLNVITIPREMDPPVISFSGDRSTGKTLSFLACICNLYHKQNQYIFIANDHANLSHSWNKPVIEKRFIEMLNIVGIKPAGIPILQLYPSKKNFIVPRDYDIDYIKIALSWNSVLDNYKEFFNLGNSEKYFEQLIPMLRGSESFEEIKNRIHGILGQGDSDVKVANKITAVIEQFWKSKIIDISDSEAVSRINVIDKFGIEKEFPVGIGLLFTGVIPSLVTSSLSKELMDRYLNNQLIEIFETQSSPSWFRDNKKIIWIAIDELQVLEKRFKETRETLDMVALEGRNVRIALMHCEQNISSISNDLAANTRYGICLNQSKPQDTKMLQEIFNLSKNTIHEIKTLKKDKMEVIACTKEKFHAYDLISGKKMMIRGEAIKGVYLPPSCLTVPPIE